MPLPDKKNDNVATAVIAVNNSTDEADAGVTYFVDEEGRYYYQPSGNNQNLVSLSTEEQVSDDVAQEAQILIDNEGYQTVALIPSDEGTGEVSYVLVMQDETKPMININIENEKKTNGFYKFEVKEDEGVGVEKSKEGDYNSKGKISTKRNKQVRTYFTCSFCTYTSHKRYLLQRHMKKHSEERPHKCSVCDRGFKTAVSLQNHVNMHNGVKPYVCKYCKSPFTTSGELVRHVRYRHTHEKPHKCTECDYASVELSKLKRHVRCHTGERPYQCVHCTYASQDTFKLKRHMRTHTGEKPYKCEYCKVSFTQSNSLKVHSLIHDESEKPVFPCELCPTKCSRKTDLRNHVQKLHTSNKPLKCKRCSKSFTDLYSCKIHNKTHEGEKCFKCKQCSYASTTLSHLKSHMLKHADEKYFVCDQCDQSFKQKQLLQRHQNLYHDINYEPKPSKDKTHSCHDCNRTFAHKGNLIRHLTIHDPDSLHEETALDFQIGLESEIEFAGENVKTGDSKNDADKMMLDLESDPIDPGELLTVTDDEGQLYVVLEVIQDKDASDQELPIMLPEDYLGEEQEVEIGTKDIYEQVKVNNLETTINIDTCFGFDEEADAANEEDHIYNDKIVLSVF